MQSVFTVINQCVLYSMVVLYSRFLLRKQCVVIQITYYYACLPTSSNIPIQ